MKNQETTRDKETLIGLSDIATLLQFLYMDEANCIVFNNGMTDLQLRLDHNLNIRCKNLGFPDSEEFLWNDGFTPASMMYVIDCLKESESVGVKGMKSRWEEIFHITKATVVINRQ